MRETNRDARQIRWLDLAGIVAAFAVPVWGVLYAGWEMNEVLVIYWLEALFTALLIPFRLYHTRMTTARDAGHGQPEVTRKTRIALALFGTFPYWVFIAIITAFFLDLDRTFLTNLPDSLVQAADEHLDLEMIALVAFLGAIQIRALVREVRDGTLSERHFAREYNNSAKPIYILFVAMVMGFGGPWGVLVLRLIFELYVWHTGKPWYYLVDQDAEKAERRYT